jgi:hypothetical protein
MPAGAVQLLVDESNSKDPTSMVPATVVLMLGAVWLALEPVAAPPSAFTMFARTETSTPAKLAMPPTAPTELPFENVHTYDAGSEAPATLK